MGEGGRRSISRKLRGWGVAASVALHASLLAFIALDLSVRPPPAPAPPNPAIEVQLVRLPLIRPDMVRPTQAPPPAPSPAQRVETSPPVAPKTPASPAIQVPPVAAPATSPQVVTGEGNDINGVVFDQRDPTHRSLRATVDCAHRNPATLTEREWKGCGYLGHYGDLHPPTYAALPSNEKEAAAVLRGAKANDAWRAYVEGRGPYPGLGAALGLDH